jgi:hypothetical protein
MTLTLKALCDAIGIATVPVGTYDAPDPDAFAPRVPLKRCLFEHYPDFQASKSVAIDTASQGCPGCGYWMVGQGRFPSRAAMVSFLADKEGLRKDGGLVEAWLDAHPTFPPVNGHIVLGPVRDEMRPFLRTVTLFVNPDQLSALVYGASYHAHPGDPEPVLAPFGSGCGLMFSMFPDLAKAQAMIGATDIAMRQHLPPELMAFTVTVPMLDRLLSLDDGHSFLGKPWLQRLRQARA